MEQINPNESDDDLMRRAAVGDTAAFDVIVRRHQHQVQRFAIRMLGGDSARGSDIAVGALLRLWERRATYEPCGKLSGWLLSTTYRLCLDALGSNPNEAEFDLASLADAADPLDARVEQASRADAVRQAVMDLPEPHRAVLILSAFEELSYDEIATALDIPAGTVASRKNHALNRLRRRLVAWEDR